jgi:predicted RNase H-like HicB family nuclease
MLQLTPVFEPVENGWWQGRVKELPEVITAAPTREEAEEHLQDAAHEYVAWLVEKGLPLPSGAVDDVELCA